MLGNQALKQSCYKSTEVIPNMVKVELNQINQVILFIHPSICLYILPVSISIYICVVPLTLHAYACSPQYLTTVIPYDVGHGPPENQTLQILIKSKYK